MQGVSEKPVACDSIEEGGGFEGGTGELVFDDRG